MDVVATIVRPAHIVAAATWFGSALVFHGFVEPTATRLGSRGDRFFLRFLCGPFRIAISIAAVVTIGAGATLYSISYRNDPAWAATAHGLAYGVGGFAALVALLIALTVTGPNTLRLGRLERELDASGWNMQKRVSTELERARHRLMVGGRIGTALLFAALLAMVFARALP